MSTRSNTEQPWYRQLWPWLLIALPTVAVCASIATLFIAMRDPDGLVVEDYYRHGLAINQTLERKELAQRLGLEAQLSIDGNTIQLHLTSATDAQSPYLVLHLLHPTRTSQDEQVQLAARGAAIYGARARQPVTGDWYVRIVPPNAAWILSGRIHAPTLHPVSLHGGD
jgi:uncharacterized protein